MASYYPLRGCQVFFSLVSRMELCLGKCGNDRIKADLKKVIKLAVN